MKKRFLAMLLALVMVVGLMPVTASAAASYSDEELCSMAKQYYTAKNHQTPPLVEVDHTDGEYTVIHLYEVATGHTATWGWYYIDRSTGKGYDFLTNDPIDLTPYAARTNTRNDEQWKNAYIRFLEEETPIYGYFDHERQEEYKLIDINGDAIPELWLDTGVTADGAKVCTYADGAVKSKYVYTGGFLYAEGQNIFVDSGGHMDVYYHTVYSMIDGEFVELHHGNYGAEDNTNVQFDADGMPVYEYFWDGRRVTSAEYEVCLDNACNGQKLLSPHDGAVWNSSLGRYTGNGLCTYDEIINEIRNYVAKPGTTSTNSKAAIDAYSIFVLNGDYKSVDYSSIDRAPDGGWGIEAEKAFALYDMDKDSIPELFIYNGDISQICALDYIYTYADGKVQLLGACGSYPRYFPGTEYPGIFSTFQSSGEGSGSYVTKQGNSLRSELVYSYNNHDSTGGQLIQRTSSRQLYQLFVSADGSPRGGEALYHASLAEINSMGWDGFVAKALQDSSEAASKISINRKNIQSLFSKLSFEYDNELALFAANLSGAAEDTTGEGIDNYFTSLGWPAEDREIYQYGGDRAFAIACAKLSKDENLLVITARGSQTPTEFIEDGLSFGTRDFFGYTTNDVIYDFERDIMAALNGELKTEPGKEGFLDSHEYLMEQPLKILVTGHSLGGAAANLNAARFTRFVNGGAWWSDLTEQGDIYCYTFGAINSLSDNTTVEQGFENIHNIYNLEDSFGPRHYGNTGLMLSGLGRGFGKFGHMDTYEYNYENRGNDTYAFGLNITNHQIGKYIDSLNMGYVSCKANSQPYHATLPTVEPIPAAGTAVTRTQPVKLDGKDVEFQCYAVKNAQGNETNYVKVRDLAQALNGTKAQFNVTWDGQIGIASNTPYQVVGGEGATPYSGDQPYRAVSSTPVRFDGSDVNLTSFSITYQGGGYTYYKLRDLGQLLGFNVKWDGGVIIETDKPYTGQ